MAKKMTYEQKLERWEKKCNELDSLWTKTGWPGYWQELVNLLSRKPVDKTKARG